MFYRFFVIFLSRNLKAQNTLKMTTNLFRGQAVKVTAAHNQFSPSETVYHVGQISKINGVISVMLTLNGAVSGAIPEYKVSPINS